MRISLNSDGELILDPRKKTGGRGAYLCFSRKCFFRAHKVGGVFRAFRQGMSKAHSEQLLELWSVVEESSDHQGS